MLCIPHFGDWRRHTNIASGAATVTPGTSVTTSGTQSVKGTPAEVFAVDALPFDAWYMRIAAIGYAAANTASSGMLDILTGAATEEVLIPNLMVGGCGTVNGLNKGPKTWEFPIYVAAGTRVSVQAAGLRLSTAFRVTIELIGGTGYPPFKVGCRVDSPGTHTVPHGVAVTCASTGGTGAWTQIIASTARDYFAFVPSFQIGNDTSWSANSIYQIGMGYGAATEEEELADGYMYSYTTGEHMSGPVGLWGPTFKNIPAGSRLVARGSCAGTTELGTSVLIHAVY